MGLDRESRDASDVRSGHGGTRVNIALVAGPDCRRQDRNAGSGHVRAHSRVTGARTGRAEIGELAVVPVGELVCGKSDLLVVRSNDGVGIRGFHPEQRHTDPPILIGLGITRDQTFVGRELIAVVEHDGPCQAPALSIHGAQHAGAAATLGNHDGPARNAGVFVPVAAG